MEIVEPIRDLEDIRKIEEVLKQQGLRDLLFFLIGINCGLRISDILNLNVEDVKSKTHISIIEKKTGKRKRFPLNKKLKPLLDKFTLKRNNKEPLFLSKFNNRMERTQCYRIINNVCKKVGISYNVGTHTLRKEVLLQCYKYHQQIVLKNLLF